MCACVCILFSFFQICHPLYPKIFRSRSIEYLQFETDFVCDSLTASSRSSFLLIKHFKHEPRKLQLFIPEAGFREKCCASFSFRLERQVVINLLQPGGENHFNQSEGEVELISVSLTLGRYSLKLRSKSSHDFSQIVCLLFVSFLFYLTGSLYLFLYTVRFS